MVGDHYTLAQVLEIGPVLVDTCALTATLFGGNPRREELPKHLEVFTPHLSHRKVYFRPGVIMEYSGTKANYPRDLCRVPKSLDKQPGFIGEIARAGCVLQFSPEEQLIYEMHDERMTRLLSGMRGNISWVDYDLLISASVFEQNGGASILSIDHPFLNSWNAACNRGYIDPEKIRFFIREDFDQFRRAEVREDPTLRPPRFPK